MGALLAVGPMSLLNPADSVNFADTSLTNLVSLGFLPSDGGSTIVELSGLGQLMSALSTFQLSLAGLRPGATGESIATNLSTDFGSLVAEAQYFVDAFNSLQSATDGLIGQAGAQGEVPLAGQLRASLNRQSIASYDNGSSSPSSLPQIGIALSPSLIAGGESILRIDMSTLRSAFEANAAGTFSLLSSAVTAFGDLATNAIGQTRSLFSAVGTIAQTQQAQLSLAELLMRNVGVGAVGLPESMVGNFGLASLLALESPFGWGTATPTFAQQLLALNQFALVSSLLG
jgi:hypothetical protein